MKTSVLLVSVALLTLVSCSRSKREVARPILLFNGFGASANDVRAIETLLRDDNLDYSTVDSRQLSDMSESQLLDSKLLIIPGGDYANIGDGLSPETTTRIHRAVKRGLNYLGICAGAILAGNNDGKGPNLAAGTTFEFYTDVDRGIHKNVVTIATAGRTDLDQYWEDGPRLDGWGTVVSKYPDGSAATVQGAVGQGWVVLCGFHPEAPHSWRAGMEFATPAAASNAYALSIIQAALDHRELTHF